MTRRLSKTARPGPLLALLLAMVPAVSARYVAALPMYASREGATCVTCHVDPTGGGIRNEFGFVYNRNRHSTEAEERWSSLTVDPKLNDWITLGIDLRVLYLAEHVNGSSETLDTSTFFPMQGQVNLAVMPHEHLALVASHGMVVDEPGFPTGYVTREIYGMFEGLPGGVYARAGRFRLPFGLRQDDHTSFTRDAGFLTYDSQKPSAGIEVGHIGSRLFVQGSFVNDDEPFVTRAQTATAKVGWAAERFQAAVSGFHREGGDNLWSLYASATHGAWTVLGEFTGGTLESLAPSNREAFFAELDYRVSRGVNLRAKVDYMDVFRGEPGGQRRRYSGDVDWNPVPFAQAKLSYRWQDEEASGIRQEYLAMLYFPF